MTRNFKYIKHKTKKCSICKKPLDVMIGHESKSVLWDDGHNAAPINSGRCCSTCNTRVVTPTRIVLYLKNKEKREINNGQKKES